MEWGNKIAVNGVRPDWLRDDERVVLIGNSRQTWGYPKGYIAGAVPEFEIHWHQAAAIRLPVDHGYYTVQRYNEQHGTSFVYWPGGDAAPADWDEGAVLFGNGRVTDRIVKPSSEQWPDGLGNWHHNNPVAHNVIGYTRRSEPTRDTVAVERRTAGEWVALIGPDKCCMEQDGVMRALTYLGLICEPTEAERIAAETGVPVETVQRVLDARS